MSGFVRYVLIVAACGLSGVTSSQDHSRLLVLPEDVEWGPGSPRMPPGAQVAVLSGDPSKPGAPYVFRTKFPDGYSVPPHWHPADENITVIKGVFVLGFGERQDPAAMRELPPGSYVTLPKEEPHYSRMKGETILQFHGVGPYDVIYANSGDDPSRRPDGN